MALGKKSKIFLGILGFLIVFRLMLPYIVLKYINKTLQEIEGFRGHVDDIDIGLYRGAYQIEGLDLKKIESEVPVPFFAADVIDISIQWKEIFKGAIAGEIVLFNPQINFAIGPTPEQSQTEVDSSWVDVVDKWIPVKLNRLAIQNGEIHYRDYSSQPEIDVYLHKVQAVATNLSNTNKSNELLPSTVTAYANAYGDGTFKLNMKLNALAKTPTFDLNAELKNVNLAKLNNFLKAYAKVDVKRGQFGLYTEIASKDGRYKGYVKPIIKDLDLLQLEKEEGNLLQIAYEAVIAGVAEILKNQSKDQIATRVPIEGTYDQSSFDIWATVGSLLKNAFISALKPSIEQTVGLSGSGEPVMSKEDKKKQDEKNKKEDKKQDKKKDDD